MAIWGAARLEVDIPKQHGVSPDSSMPKETVVMTQDS
jgi:hypothetical protein